MRILLDECVPRPLSDELAGHEVRTVRQMRWSGIENGDLLRLAETSFDVFLTVDQNIPFQQSVSGLEIAVIILEAHSNRLQSLRPLVPALLKALETMQPGTVLRIGADS